MIEHEQLFEKRSADFMAWCSSMNLVPMRGRFRCRLTSEIEFLIPTPDQTPPAVRYPPLQQHLIPGRHNVIGYAVAVVGVVDQAPTAANHAAALRDDAASS